VIWLGSGDNKHNDIVNSGHSAFRASNRGLPQAILTPVKMRKIPATVLGMVGNKYLPAFAASAPRKTRLIVVIPIKRLVTLGREGVLLQDSPAAEACCGNEMSHFSVVPAQEPPRKDSIKSVPLLSFLVSDLFSNQKSNSAILPI
jgi:hypothetical protein